jgi:hypothetical protein
VTGVALSVENDPYPVVVPNSTCELEDWSVVQVIVADVAVTPVEVTALIVGTVAVVEKVKFVEVVVPAGSVEITA